MTKDFEVIVVGGGHAGIEAAAASAGMGLETALITGDIGRIGEMSCNPAIGGVGKGQLVREVDALGGLIGYIADNAGIHFRTLNRSKGPAVWSSRAQADRKLYRKFAQRELSLLPNLTIIEGMVTAIRAGGGYVNSVMLLDGKELSSDAVILCCGTFLNGVIHIGERQIEAGRINEAPSRGLTESLQQLGFKAGRLKTGTPPRLDGSTIDFARLKEQPGDDDFPPFSMRSDNQPLNRVSCHITYTTEKSHEIIRENFQKSAMFSGQINSIGPRYCPSIEDKVYRFAERERHQLFLEPEGLDTTEIYLNGLSTSLPEDIQLNVVHSISGLEEAVMNRPGYAIEYDFFPAHQIKSTLETRPVENLYFAGQINGTSGYEEAAAQGLVAGINAALKLRGRPPFYLDRSEAYIGVMIDDLITKTPVEPYRMFTSRAEYRLALREDNVADRLIKYGHNFGLVAEEHYQKHLRWRESIDAEKERLKRTMVAVSYFDNSSGNGDRASMAQLLKRPEVSYSDLTALDRTAEEFPQRQGRQVEIEIKYQGYLDKQQREIRKFRRLESLSIPDNFDYSNLTGLKREALDTLLRFRPISLGQASRLAGVTYSDLTVLMIYLKKQVGAAVSRETPQ